MVSHGIPGSAAGKLSLAIALIGRSPLLFLDEPSAAVDAGAKRHLWKALTAGQRGSWCLETSHDWESFIYTNYLW